jgi:hypothetical protein
MTTLLLITAPWDEKDAINDILIERGHGPCMSIPMVGDRDAQRDEEGNLLETPTHVGTNWYVAGHEPTLETIKELRETTFVHANVLIRGNPEDVPEGLDVIPGDIADTKGTWNAMLGDSIVIRHKQFGAQWGWRAEMNVQSGDFEPGVRAVAIYSDANHQDYLYTTGAFAWDAIAQRWVTEWNPGNTSKQDFHWAVLYASLQEQKGTLAADADASALFLKYGLPPVPPEPGEEWIDTGAVVTGQAGQLYYLSIPIATIGLVAGQAIKLGDAETTYVSTWAGTDNLMQISPYVAASTGAKLWKWE